MRYWIKLFRLWGETQFLILLLLLLFKGAIYASDSELLNLRNCIEAIRSGETIGNSNRTLLLSSDVEKNKGSLLVLTKGKAIILGSYKEEGRAQSLFFDWFDEKAKQKIIFQVIMGNNGDIQHKITTTDQSDKKTRSNQLDSQKYLEFAGAGVLALAKQKLAKTESQIRFYNSEYEVGTGGSVLLDATSADDVNANLKNKLLSVAQIELYRKSIKQQLENERKFVGKTLSRLRSCESIKNENIQQALKMEQKRLEKIRAFLIEPKDADQKSESDNAV